MKSYECFLSHVTFLSSNEVLVVFNISYSHANTNLAEGHFLHEQFLLSRSNHGRCSVKKVFLKISQI